MGTQGIKAWQVHIISEWETLVIITFESSNYQVWLESYNKEKIYICKY